MEVPYFLSKYDPDPLRSCLTATAPGTRDTEFSWKDLVERNNNELVATWGNLALAREANVYTFATLPSAPLGTGSAGLDRKAP